MPFINITYVFKCTIIIIKSLWFIWLKHKYEGQTTKTIARYEYTEKDQISKLQLGLKPGVAYLQNINYSYLPNGYLSEINPGGLGTRDIYYQKINYKDITGQISAVSGQHNGNIAEIITQVRAKDRLLMGYKYDVYNRLKESYSANININNANPANQNQYFSKYTYDKRGNITNIQRDGMYPLNGALTKGRIDKLALTVPGGGNKVTKVTDSASAALKSYGAKVTTSGNYEYDNDGTKKGNGNITYDPTKNAVIHYNHLDLPRRIIIDDNKIIEFTYDSKGTLLKKVVSSEGENLEIRTYIDGLEFKSGKLVQVNHDYGRLTLTDPCHQNQYIDGLLTGTELYKGEVISSDAHLAPSADIDYKASNQIRLTNGFNSGTNNQFLAKIETCTDDDWQYEYAIKDHLGNTRVLFTDRNNNGEVDTEDILAENHYYPFGMEMNGDWQERNKQDYQYKYNGKELTQDFGLGWYNYGSRFYDPAIGRFISVDPQADAPNLVNWSPYHYTYNNPIAFVDPDGENPIRALMAAAKVGKRAYKAYRKAKKAGRKLTSKDLKQIGLDEVMDMADDFQTIFSAGDVGFIERLAAAGDLIIGTDFNNKKTRAARKGADAVDDASDANKARKRAGSSKNEKHGDSGRSMTKAEQQMQDLQDQMQGANKKTRKKLQNKINNIKRDAQKKAKGEEHSRTRKG